MTNYKMRSELKKIDKQRKTFQGVFVRFGEKKGYQGRILTTILLKDVFRSGKKYADHLWFNLTKGFEKLNLKEGDKIQFDARVREYEKGYKGYRDDVDSSIEIDYKLSHPTKIYKIKK